MKQISFVLLLGGLLCALVAPAANGQDTSHGTGLPAGHGAGRAMDHANGLIKIMILDGQSAGTYHNWRLTTPVLKKELEETGLFEVTVVTAPHSGEDLSQFRPEFAKYRVIVSNLDTPDWPEALRTRFEEYVRNGGGLVIVHAADNAFPHW